MKLFAVDDERVVLDDLCQTLAKAQPDATILAFRHAKPALEAIELYGQKPDVVFSGIELPGIDGLDYAKRLKTLAPRSKLVFVTAYPSYAVEAFRLHVDGFVVKPVDQQRIEEELEALFPEPNSKERPKLIVRCFGNFDVFVGTEPLVFSRVRTKELLAFLVDRRGGTCTSGDIETALWEGEETKSHKSYLRVLANDLRKSLSAAGLQDMLVHEHGQWAVRTELLECDYYRMLAGDLLARKAFVGEYMKQYSWAEETVAKLHFAYGRGYAG